MRRLRSRLAGDSRLRRILRGGLSGLIGRAISLGINALTLPLTLRYLGPQRYGVWVTVSTSVVMLSVMDLGIANTLTNLISQAFAREDRKAARTAYATAFWVSSGVSLAVCVLCLAVWRHLNWARLFHIADPALLQQATSCVAVAVVFFLLSLPLNLVHKVLSGYQQTQITNYFNVLSSLLGLLAILCVVSFRGSLLMLTLVYSGSLLAGTVVLNAWVNLWDRRWLLPHPKHVERGTAGSLMSSGMGFFVLQLAGLVVFNSDNLIITHCLGPAAVTPYSVTWRLAGYAAVLQTAIFPSLWPAYAEAYTRGDFDWVRRTFWSAVRVTLGATLAAVGTMAVFGQALIRWYVGAAAVPGKALLYAICAWTLLSAGMDLQACLLAAINRIKWQGILSAVAAVVNVAFSLYLTRRMGSIGTVLGTMGSYLLVLLVPQTVIVWQALYRPPAVRRLPDPIQQHA